MSRPDVFICCAEPSGDMHAAGLARALHARRPDLNITGAGGTLLRDAGVDVWHDTVGRARFGLTSFLRAPEIWAMLRDLRHRFRQAPPRLVVVCDSWTLNKHVLALAGQAGCRRMYYVSPQVWASREGRVRHMARMTDAVACILPFEEAWLRRRGVNATFVGHPLFDHVVPQPPQTRPRFPDAPPRVAINAGSRANTVRANLPGLLSAAAALRRDFPGATFVTPTVAATEPVVRAAAPAWLEIAPDGFDAAVASADLALTVSGTATLHTAAYGVPMVVVYRASRVLWHLIGRHIVKTRTFALVNLLDPHPDGGNIVEELVPWTGRPEPVVAAARRLLDDPQALATQRRKLSDVVAPLRQRGAGDAAAAMALCLLHGDSGVAS